MRVKHYIALARLDHWIKNVFVLPGSAFALLLTRSSALAFLPRIGLGLLATCFISSANYVINEWVDAEFDRHHPTKKNRAAAAGSVEKPFVYLEYFLFSSAGLSLAAFLPRPFLLAEVSLLVMGLLYNLEPVRTKDRAYLDVLSESVNNPIRLLLGWFIVAPGNLPPVSLILAYWMGGAFLMAVKRFAEYRFIGNPDIASLYRKSFRSYDETKLLVSCCFYAVCSGFFLGITLIKYRVELVLSFPFIAILFAWYLRIGFKKDSAAQHPERLHGETFFMLFVGFLIALISVLLAVDLKPLHWLLRVELLSYK